MGRPLSRSEALPSTRFYPPGQRISPWICPGASSSMTNRVDELVVPLRFQSPSPVEGSRRFPRRSTIYVSVYLSTGGQFPEKPDDRNEPCFQRNNFSAPRKSQSFKESTSPKDIRGLYFSHWQEALTEGRTDLEPVWGPLLRTAARNT